MKSIAILELMVQDHGKIVALMKNVEKNLGKDLVSLVKIFETFEWQIEKHIFTEEKAIFSSYSPTNITEGYKMVPQLIKEHNEILNTLRLMRKDIMFNRPFNFEQFKETLMVHKTFEEASLYPKLDQELSTAQKDEIIKRIQELL